MRAIVRLEWQSMEKKDSPPPKRKKIIEWEKQPNGHLYKSMEEQDNVYRDRYLIEEMK